MKKSWKWLVLASCLCVPLTAHAHRAWLLPSATVLSGDDVWITVDAAVSNDLFYFEHFPLRIANLGGPTAQLPGGRGRPANLSITGPDGSAVPHHNGSMGRYRSTFDVHLTQKGTYKIAVTNTGVFARYKEDGRDKRWSGTLEAFAKEVPQNAEGLQATYMQSRNEVFVTSGKPTAGTEDRGQRSGACAGHPSQRPRGRQRRHIPIAARRQARAQPEGLDRSGRQPVPRQAGRHDIDHG